MAVLQGAHEAFLIGAVTARAAGCGGYASAVTGLRTRWPRSRTVAGGDSAAGVRELDKPAQRLRRSSLSRASARVRDAADAAALVRGPAAWREHQSAGRGDLPRARGAGRGEHHAVALELDERRGHEVRPAVPRNGPDVRDPAGTHGVAVALVLNISESGKDDALLGGHGPPTLAAGADARNRGVPDRPGLLAGALALCAPQRPARIRGACPRAGSGVPPHLISMFLTGPFSVTRSMIYRAVERAGGRLRSRRRATPLRSALRRLLSNCGPSEPVGPPFSAVHNKSRRGSLLRCMRRAVVTLVVGLVLGAVALPCRASAGWGPARILEHSIFKAAGNARGEQAFIWQTTTAETVMLGGFPYAGMYPVSAWDGRGVATVLWSDARRDSIRMMVSVRAPGGRFGAGTELGQVDPRRDGTAALSVAADGSAVVGWTEGRRVFVTQRPAGRCAAGAARACFGPTQRLAGGRCPVGIEDCLRYADMVVSAAANGPALVGYSAVKRSATGFHTFIRFAVAPRGHRFVDPVELSGPDDVATGVRIARLRDAGAVVTWVSGPTIRTHRVVGVLVGRDGAPRSRAVVLSDRTCVASLLAVDAHDDVTMTWLCRHNERPNSTSIAAATFPWGWPAGARRGPRSSRRRKQRRARDRWSRQRSTRLRPGRLQPRRRDDRHARAPAGGCVRRAADAAATKGQTGTSRERRPAGRGGPAADAHPRRPRQHLTAQRLDRALPAAHKRVRPGIHHHAQHASRIPTAR